MAVGNSIPTSRQAALEVGAKKFFTGEPCRKGHISPFYVSVNKCCACISARAKERYLRDPAAAKLADRERSRRYSERHPERRKASKQRWADANKEALAEIVRISSRKWYWKNRDKARESNKQWMRNNKGKVVAKNTAREMALLRAIPSWAEHEAIKAIYADAERLTSATGVLYSVDHIVPIRGKTVCGLHCAANLRVIPATENYSKGNRYWPDMP